MLKDQIIELDATLYKYSNLLRISNISNKSVLFGEGNIVGLWFFMF